MKPMQELLVLSFICTSATADNPFPTILSDPTSSLHATLKKFDKSRHHLASPARKRKAKTFIERTFRQSGLHVWSEHVDSRPAALHGENIVGKLKGTNTGTAGDGIVIVGAHYDTVSQTKGVDDNGSGVTALLEVAKQIGKAGCRHNNSIMFVAFDFEEDTADMDYPAPFGSKSFVQNLTRYLSKTGGTVKAALILEMLANHNTSKESQLFPRGFQFISPKAYKDVQQDGKRGNFLAVVGRQTDQPLMALVKKFYQQDCDFRAQPVPIPLAGRPTTSRFYMYLKDFYRSDHYNFWENSHSYSAVMLTDTSNFRRNMDKCYHKRCDNMRQIKENDLEFLRRNINAVIRTTLELSGAEFCYPSSDSAKSKPEAPRAREVILKSTLSNAVKIELGKSTATSLCWNLTVLPVIILMCILYNPNG